MEKRIKAIFYNVNRREVLLEDTQFYPIEQESNSEGRRLKIGTSVNAIYDIVLYVYVKDNVSHQQNQNIDNIINAYFILKGSDAVDEKNLAKFIKKETGISVKIEFISVGKHYETGFRPCVKVKSETINLLNNETNFTVE